LTGISTHVLIHEAIHGLLKSKSAAKDPSHDNFSKYRIMSLEALKEYRDDNKLSYTNDQLEIISWYGLTDSKAFDKYINDLAAKNKTTYDEEYGKWYNAVTELQWEEKKEEKKEEPKNESDTTENR